MRRTVTVFMRARAVARIWRESCISTVDSSGAAQMRIASSSLSAKASRVPQVGLSPIVKPLLFIVTASTRDMSRRVADVYIESNKAAGKLSVVDGLTERLDTMVVFKFVD